jgi:MFS family permease
LITIGQVIAYSRGMRPGTDYQAARRPRMSRRQFVGTVLRTVGYSAAALVCGIFAQHLEHPWRFAVRVGMVTGLVTGAGIIVNPYIEYYADRLPERTLGVLGIVLILCGFVLQSVQYWVALLDVQVV